MSYSTTIRQRFDNANTTQLQRSEAPAGSMLGTWTRKSVHSVKSPSIPLDGVRSFAAGGAAGVPGTSATSCSADRLSTFRWRRCLRTQRRSCRPWDPSVFKSRTVSRWPVVLRRMRGGIDSGSSRAAGGSCAGFHRPGFSRRRCSRSIRSRGRRYPWKGPTPWCMWMAAVSRSAVRASRSRSTRSIGGSSFPMEIGRSSRGAADKRGWVARMTRVVHTACRQRKRSRSDWCAL